MGVVAIHDIQAGQLLLAERPVMVMPKQRMGIFSPLDMERTRANQANIQISKLLELVKPDDRVAFEKLHNAFVKDGHSGIMTTNWFGLQGIEHGESTRCSVPVLSYSYPHYRVRRFPNSDDLLWGLSGRVPAESQASGRDTGSEP